MSVLSIPNSFSPNTVIQSSQVNANYSAIATEYNSHAVQTDVAKTITVTHTFSASQTFTGGWTAAAACTISSGGLAVTGASTITGSLGGITTLATSGAINGQTISGDANFTGNLHVAQNLTVVAGLTALSNTGTETLALNRNDVGQMTVFRMQRSGVNKSFVGLDVSDNFAIISSGAAVNFSLTDAGVASFPRGGISAAGNSTITGNLNVTGTITGLNGAPSHVRLSTDATDTTGSPVNSSLTIALGVSQTWRLEFDLGIACNNTGGVTLQFSAPTGATGHAFWIGATSSHTAIYNRSCNSFGSVQTWSTFNSAGDADGVHVHAVAIVTTDGTHAGNFVLQYAAAVAAQTATLRADSTLMATRIA